MGEKKREKKQYVQTRRGKKCHDTEVVNVGRFCEASVIDSGSL